MTVKNIKPQTDGGVIRPFRYDAERIDGKHQQFFSLRNLEGIETVDVEHRLIKDGKVTTDTDYSHVEAWDSLSEYFRT